MLLGFSAYGIAQNYIEVVYLKNGSIIRGVVIEQVPNVSLKIKTADGSIFAYPMSEVERITKEMPSRYKNYEEIRSGKNRLKGYKGFVDAGFTFDVSDYDANKFELSTSHGYQFNNHFFVGGGLALNYYTDLDLFSVPIFTNFRANFMNQKITPYGDIKMGYSAGDIEGFYAAFAFGVRFSLVKKTALNLSIGYTLQQDDYSYYSYSSSSYYYYYDDYTNLSGISLKVGFEF